MFNKLSFLPSESLYPVCLSLDDFEDDNTQVVHIPSRQTDRPDYTYQYNRYMERIKNACTGTLSAEEEKELLEIEKKIMPVDGIVHKTALDSLISSFVSIIEPADSHVGLKQIRLRTVSNEYIPEYYFSMENLGYYDSYNTEIVLCPERISRQSAKLFRQNKHITSRELYVVVLVHALAHAFMDPTKSEEKSYTYQPIIMTENGFSEREVLMEESLANMITLQYCDQLSKPEVVRSGEVKEFIELQSLPYSFGLDQYDILKPDWRLWREAKKTTKFIKEK